MQRLSPGKLMAAALLGMMLPGCGFHHRAHRSEDYKQMWAGVEQTVLPNGLTLMTQEIHSAPVVCVYVYYRVGSRDEGPHQHGISHLLEHMMFKGSAHYPLGEMDRLYTEMGGSYNASTSRDYTAYHETLPSSGLDTALKVEADRMQNLTVDIAQLEHEKSVVLSELDGDDNDPKERLDKAVDKAAFTIHPYQNPIIGYPEEVKTLTVSDVKQYYREHYAPNNAVLVVAGDFHTTELRKAVDANFGIQERRPVPPHSPVHEPPQREEHRLTVFETGKVSRIEIGYHVPSMGERDPVVLDVISYVLAAGTNSRFNRDLLDTHITAGQDATVMESGNPYLFKVTATPQPGRSLSEVENKLEWELKRLVNDPVSEEDLNNAKAKIIARLIYHYADVSNHAGAMGFYTALATDQSPERTVEEVESVTADEIQSAARRYFMPENRTVGWLWATGGSTPAGVVGKSQPAGTEESPGDSAAAHPAADHAPDPAILKAALLSLQHHPPVMRQRLANGLTILIYPDHASPEIAIACGITAGPLWDPPGMPGTAYLALYGLHWGTRTQNGWRLASRTEEVGADITPQLQADGIIVNGRCLKGDLPGTLDVLADEIRNPEYSPSSLTEQKKLLDSLSLIHNDNPEIIARRSFFEALYPSNSPLHWYQPGTPQIRSRISPADLHQFHDTYYRPDRTTLVIVGDIDKDAALDEVKGAFGSWTAPPGLNPSIPQIPGAISGARKVFHAVAGAHETRVVMGFSGIERGQPDYYAALMANDILGGGYRSSRFWQHLRQEQGLVYHVSSNWEAGLAAGPWIVSFGSSPNNVDRVIHGVIGDMKELQKSGVSVAELDAQKSWMAGAESLLLRTHEKLAAKLLYAEMYGLGMDYPWQFAARMAAVKPEEVQRAARLYFHPEDMTVSAAGPE